MDIQINTAISITNVGKREKNEDAIFPPPQQIELDIASKLYIVCDGMGGHGNGELASQTVIDTISKILPQNVVSTEQSLNEVVKKVSEVLNEYIIEYPDKKGMGSTLALIHIHEEGISVAHIGDSRIYQFRKGQILFKTKDHKWINSLIESGALTAAEAEKHPRKNVLSRALQAGNHNDVLIEYNNITDVEPNDIILLCSDGVLETFNDEVFEKLFVETDLKFIEQKIINECEIHSKDNFSAYLIQIGTVENSLKTVKAEIIEDPLYVVDANEIVIENEVIEAYEVPKLNRRYDSTQIWFKVLLALLFAVFLYVVVFNKEKFMLNDEKLQKITPQKQNKQKELPKKTDDKKAVPEEIDKKKVKPIPIV